MKIALINNCANIAGVGVYAYSLLNNLRSMNDIEPRMICTSTFPSIGGSLNNTATYLLKSRLIPINQVLDYFINPLLLSKEYDVYHVTTHSLARFAKFNHPSVVTVHDLSPFMKEFAAWSSYERISSYKNPIANTLWREFHKKSTENIRYADAIICISKFMKDELIKVLNLKTRIKVILQGVDHDLFRPRDKYSIRKRLGLPVDKRIILHVGDEGGRKNIPTLIKALNVIHGKGKNITLVRVGDKRRETEMLIDKYKLATAIQYAGIVSREEVAYFYNASDLFVFPSLYEGFGMPILEAMSSGCPVIAGNRTAIPEVVANAGVLIDSYDHNLLAEKILELLEDDDLRREFINRGLKRATMFSWTKNAEETIRLYQQVCN